MAAKQGASTTTYSPRIIARTRPPIFKDFDLDWTRPDGRGFHQCRPALLQTGAVSSVSGSAYAEFGNTKVIVSVIGPRESKKATSYSDVGRLNCNVSYTIFAAPALGSQTDHKEYSSMLHKALEGVIMMETFQKTTVDVFALVLESGGSDLPVVISCASLALADAGIMMYDLITAVSVSTQLTITGEWATPNINEAMQLCVDASSKLGEIMRDCLKQAASASDE
ncbi:BnaC07g50290D [Brassica napus]|uniref:BnaC07g50290D protein n=1 Tax=Brassica napus TaxID=3708 RepID=A0A078J2F6_BRANA|nr:BnaC07g50290D [Brassica napus]